MNMGDNDLCKKETPKFVRAKLAYNPPAPKAIPSHKNIHTKTTINKTDSTSRSTCGAHRSEKGILKRKRSSSVESIQKNVQTGNFKTANTESAEPADLTEKPIQELRSNFVQMKEERDQCSNDLIDFLNQSIAKTLTNEKQTINSRLETTHNSLILSPICPTVSAKIKPTTPRRTSSIQDPIPTVLTMGSDAPLTATTTSRKYDSVEAKKFILQQKQKRQLESKKASVQITFDAEERKRRLAELHKNSMRILQKCVRKKRTRTGSATTSGEVPTVCTEQKKTADNIKIIEEPNKRDIINPPNKPNRPDRGVINFVVPSSNSLLTNPVSESIHSEQSEHQISTGTMPSSKPKRIGILRRSEPATIVSPMDIHFDNILSPSLFVPAEISTAVTATSIPNSPRKNNITANLSIPNAELKSDKLTTNLRKPSDGRPIISTTEPTLHKHLNTSSYDSSRNLTTNSTTINVPYWLKPSPLQIYPYNFIMAVRKKLELIADPKASFKSDKEAGAINVSTKKMSNSHGHRSLRKNDEFITFQPEPNKSKINYIDENTSESVAMSHSKSFSDAITNMSSMTLNVPGSSNSKNAAPVATDSDGTLSISSAIFSQSSPEKKPLDSRLPQQIIEPIKVSSRVTLSHPFINSHRGEDSRKLRHALSKSLHSDSSRVDQTNIVDMLNSFNQSLSHAISVNEKLHEALEKPITKSKWVKPSNLRSALNSNNSVYEYSYKFESDTISGNHVLSESFLDNESSIRSSSFASESARSNNGDPKNSNYDKSPMKDDVSNKSKREQISSSDRPSVIVRVSKTNSEISQKSTSSYAELGTTSHTILDDEFVRNKSNSSSVTRQNDKVQEVISTHTSTDRDSIRTEFSHETRETERSHQSSRSLYGKNDVNNAKNSVEKYDRSRTNEDVSGLRTERQSNKENVSSIINTNTHRSISESISNKDTIQESTVQIQAENDLHTYREENASVIKKIESIQKWENTSNETGDADLNQSIGNDIFSMFNQTDMMEYSIRSTTETMVSETNLSYSTLGMYDQLLKTEEQKSTDLMSLLKMREKALIDRTKGQVAWLELQKQKYQERGLTAEITTVKKKQRALLMRLEKDRAELGRSSKNLRQHHHNQHSKTMAPVKLNHLKMKSVHRTPRTETVPKAALRALDMSACSNVEEMLQRREEELQLRRQHVEHLIQWHQRLDEEEHAVYSMERMLMSRTQIQQKKIDHTEVNPSQQRKQISKIEKSLEVLQSISCHNSSDINDPTQQVESVKVSGSKMNRLWRRLTGETEAKFVPTKRYTLSKEDIERLYEDAKMVVLGQFAKGPRVLDQTIETSIVADTEFKEITTQHKYGDEFLVIPSLDLNFNSAEETSPATTDAEGSGSGYYFSDYTPSAPSVGGQQFYQKQLAIVNEIPTYNNAFALTGTHSEGTIYKEENEISASDFSIPNPSSSVSYTADFSKEGLKSTQSTEFDKTPSDHSRKSVVLENIQSISSENTSSDILTNKSSETLIANIPSSQFEISAVNMSDADTLSMINDNKDQHTDSSCIVSDTDKSQHYSAAEINENMNMDVDKSEALSFVAVEQIVTENIFSTSNSEIQEEILLSENEVLGTISEGKTSHSLTDSEDVYNIKSPAFNDDTSTIATKKSTEIVEQNGQSESIIGNHVAPRDYVSPSITQTEQAPHKIRIISSEAEVLRRQQIEIEEEIKQLEQNAPFVFMREIPNKPPPPYVPPAHGSPMTVLFPSEDRIKNIVYQRVRELYSADDNTPFPDANVTNIFERIILDICSECFLEMPTTHRNLDGSVSEQSLPNNYVSRHFNHSLTFHNPPDMLKCIQKHILQRVKKLLQNSRNTSDHNQRNPPTQLYSRLVSSKRKRDLVDEILVQEMREDDAIWTNFDVERSEVLHSVTNDLMRIMVKEALNDCQRAFYAKALV